jgi:quercetin dioxygenase-like cupin family protein
MSELVDRVVVLDAQDEVACPAVPIVEGEGEARAVVWPGMGARHRSMHRVRLGAGARTIALRHPGEAVWYVIQGHGSVTDEDSGEAQDIVAGSMVHVGPGDSYRLVAGAGEMRLAGGPCPPDPALYAHLENA